MIRVDGIHRSFTSSTGTKEVLAGVTFDVPENCVTTIFGPNGCGKTTLINIITGLDEPERGEVSGVMKRSQEIGYVFQDYRRSLLPWGSVEENILFPLTLRGVGGKAAQARLDEVFQLVSLPLDRRQKVYSLSGGQAQAVCLLRALIIKPKLLVLDEPFAALDYELTIELRRILADVCKSLQLSVILISHDLDEAIVLGDQLIFLTRSPTTVAGVLPIRLPYPRTVESLTTPGFIALKSEALQIFAPSSASLTGSLF